MKIVFGFTLIEMALVLIILGLLMGSLLFPLPKQIEQKRINITQQRLDEIKEALLGFAVLHNRLPCPASDENGLESTCNNEGNIPWRVLGVGRYDTWGNPFRYRVDSKYTVQLVPTDPLAPIPPNTSSGLVVQDTHLMTPIKLVAPESETTTSRVVAIIFSYGKDRQANAENSGVVDHIYAQDAYVENTFDDILIWLPKSILINRLVAAKKWLP
ncbi:MAG: hypothetical protein DRQ49_07145 [Gammaproteobacteria bacterium]|nr:MAG: hypothetical protein DRQ49_07145 [Gammaproteobacteria bacterium]RKZ44926.1 MAG: hypothetical protein DRQ41_01565 [Gammaproteobacteria bacterium]RKZ76543.1 MAG: hypothetical protein DRQ57_03275 [Gammaproteobacteria bacterium]